MDVVDGRRSDSLDELLANFEFPRIKEYVEKRSRDEAAQAQVTVTPVDTVQYCSPCSPDPEPSSSVCVKLENTEGKMGPELEELESPSAGTGQNVRTAVSPERGDMGDCSNHRLRYLDHGRGFKPNEKYSVTYGTSNKYENHCKHLVHSCDPVKTQAQDI